MDTSSLRAEFVGLEQQYFEDLVHVAQANGASYEEFAAAIEEFYETQDDTIDVALSYWQD